MTPHDLLTLAQSVRVDLLRAHLTLLLDRPRDPRVGPVGIDAAADDALEQS